MDDEIDALTRRSAGDASVIALGGGLPAVETFPRAKLAAAFARSIRDDDSALQYGWPEGRERLRDAIAKRLRARGADVTREDVIVTSGAQQAIAIAASLCCGANDLVYAGEESYPAALDLFRMRSLVPTSRLDGASAIYVMPAISNPRGRTLSPTDRAALLERDLPIIEDDAYADVCFDPPVPAPMLAHARDRVFHVGSFSKTLAPGLRVGYLVAPRDRVEEVQARKHAQDLQANSLAQTIVEHYLEDGDFDAHLERLRGFYARRARCLGAALRTYVPGVRFEAPVGGFSIWVETSLPGDEAELLARGIEHGVSFDPGRSFSVERRRSEITMRLSFSQSSEGEIEEGARRLARALAAFARARGIAPRSLVA